MASHPPAAEVAKWQGSNRLWIDHARVSEGDLEWMAPVASLILWNVRLPEGFLAELPNLRGVSVRGGSRDDVALVAGCDALLSLDVNQVRGLHDLGAIAGLRSLEFLSLYGLPRVEEIPDLAELQALRHLQLGSLKGLKSLAGVASIPRLETLQFSRRVEVTPGDLDLLAGHPTLVAFDWFAEDVPNRVVDPVLERLSHLGRPPAVRPEEWLAQRLGTGP